MSAAALLSPESPTDRAERLALAIASAVASLPVLPLREARDARRRGAAALAELEALLGVRDLALPDPGRTAVQRALWGGFAGAGDDDRDAAALACWSALGEPAEAYLMTWRAALLGSGPRPLGPRPPRWNREDDAVDKSSRIPGDVPAYRFGW